MLLKWTLSCLIGSTWPAKDSPISGSTIWVPTIMGNWGATCVGEVKEQTLLTRVVEDSWFSSFGSVSPPPPLILLRLIGFIPWGLKGCCCVCCCCFRLFLFRLRILSLLCWFLGMDSPLYDLDRMSMGLIWSWGDRKALSLLLQKRSSSWKSSTETWASFALDLRSRNCSSSAASSWAHPKRSSLFLRRSELSRGMGWPPAQKNCFRQLKRMRGFELSPEPSARSLGDIMLLRVSMGDKVTLL